MIDGFLQKLDANPPDPATLKAKAMPQIVNAVKQSSGKAPQEVRLQIKGVFDENNVLPNYDADVASLKQALNEIKKVVAPSVNKGNEENDEKEEEEQEVEEVEEKEEDKEEEEEEEDKQDEDETSPRIVLFSQISPCLPVKKRNSKMA